MATRAGLALLRLLLRLLRALHMSEAPSTAYIEARSQRQWDERLRSSASPAAEWSVLEAYLARVDCDADFSTPQHAARLEFARAALDRLLRRDTLAFAKEDPNRRRLVARFRPQLLAGA